MSNIFKINNQMLPLSLLNFASFFQYQRFVMPISFLFYLQNGLNFSDFILFQSIFNAVCLLMKIPMGYIGDMFSKKYILIFSYFLFMLRVILWIYFSGFWIILAGEVLYGLFKALYRGNVDSYIYEYLKSENMDKSMISNYGNLTFWTSIGSAVSCVACVLLYKFYGFKTILLIELVFQIISIIMLLFIPNVKSEKASEIGIFESIKTLVKNKKINTYIYYSVMLNGLTSVFVWNFQPLLKLSFAPTVFYGIITFINQSLRGFGGMFANRYCKIFSNEFLIKSEYTVSILSFLVLLIAVYVKNVWLTVASLILISFGIFMFVIFNIYTISKIHENIEDKYRATLASTNTFFSDFASFIMLLLFKISFDNFGLIKTLLIFLVIFLFLLRPYKFCKTV
ncbi:MFS transporter [bacterium]|nr:MFS transporter [bacterium]